MKFQRIELVRISVFPVVGCLDQIASYAFQDDGSGNLILLPKFSFGGHQPSTRTLALDALPGLFGMLVPSNGSHLYASRSNPPVRAQLDLVLTILAEGESRTVPVQIRYGIGCENALVPSCRTFGKGVALESVATICWQDSPPMGSDVGTNEAGRTIREAFREVDRIKNISSNWAAGMTSGLPKVIRVRSAAGTARWYGRPSWRFQSALDISLIGAGGDALVKAVLGHVGKHEGEVGLRQLEQWLDASGIFPEGSGRTFDLSHQPPGVRQDGNFLHPLDQLGSYELPTLKIIALLYALSSRNSIIILDGLDRVLDENWMQRIIALIKTLRRAHEIKLIISARGANWAYREKTRADPPNVVTRPLQHATPREMHPRNLLSKLTIYVEGRYDKFFYSAMLGEDLLRRVRIINPHEDLEFSRSTAHRKHAADQAKPSIVDADGYRTVIEAVKFRRTAHGDLGKTAFIGICDGDAACAYGELQTLLDAESTLFQLLHKDLGETIYFLPYHAIENVMIVEGKALEYIQLSRPTHGRRDLAPEALITSEIQEADIGFNEAEIGLKKHDITDEEIDISFLAALDKFRYIQGPGKLGTFSRKSRDSIVKRWRCKKIDASGIEYSNTKIYEDYGLDPFAFTEGRNHRRSLKLRFCDGESLINLARKKIKQPIGWEQGLIPFIANSAFAAIFRNMVEARINELELRLMSEAPDLYHGQRHKQFIW